MPEGSTSKLIMSMTSMKMERGRQNLQNICADGSRKNVGKICFSCDQIFANRKFLEEHICRAASHICSCGTEFAVYEDMLYHSTTHEPGHQVLDHETIRKRRIEKCKEEEEKLKRLQSGEVVWKVPKLHGVPSLSLSAKSMPQVPITSARPQKPMQSAQISQVSALYPSLSTPVPRNSFHSEKDVQNIFAGVGSPTVDLWTLYQPAVLVQTVRKFNKDKPFTCGKCGEGFLSKNSVISHNSSHVTDRISGCIGCGLLLSSKKLVPRFHVCNSPSTATKFRLITAEPMGYKSKIKVAGMSQNPNSQRHHVTSLQLKSKYPSAPRKGNGALHVTSALQLKNQNLRAYNKSSQGPHGTPSRQWKSQHFSASKPYTISPLLSKSSSPHPIASNKSSWGLPITHSVQLKTTTASSDLTIPSLTSSTANGFTCRVCHIPFDTAQLLQRHKCAKAKEFMAKHRRGGKLFHRQIPVASTNLMNGDRKLAFPAKNQVLTIGLDKGQSAVPINVTTGADMEDDCYIIESGTDKPAEMIYQVSSSVPIKT